MGGADALARGDSSSLTVHHFYVGGEAAYSLFRWLIPFVHVEPSAIHLRATLSDPMVLTPLVSRGFTWGLDLTAGARGPVFAVGHPDQPIARFFLGAEVGYAFAGSKSMTLEAHPGSDDPSRYGTTTLPALRPSGATFRISATATF